MGVANVTFGRVETTRQGLNVIPVMRVVSSENVTTNASTSTEASGTASGDLGKQGDRDLVARIVATDEPMYATIGDPSTIDAAVGDVYIATGAEVFLIVFPGESVSIIDAA